jgi:hypothetical protein
MRTTSRQKRDLRRGATAVEFAIVAPVFFVFLLAAFEFGWLNVVRHTADNAAYEAARTAVVPGATVAEAKAKADKLLKIVGTRSAQVTVTPSPLTVDSKSVTVKMWGRARVLILPALLVLLIGIPAAFMTVPLEGGVGGPYYAPTSRAELQDHYQLAFGKLTLDLSQMPVGTDPITVQASVGAGGLEVVVPDNAQVQVDTDVGAGYSYVLGDSQGGTDLSNHYELGDLGRLIVLDLSAGLGGIEVHPGYDNQFELDYGAY